MAIRALVLAGLPTTRTRDVFGGVSDERLALTAEDGPVGREQVGPLHAVLAGPGADEQGDVGVAEGHVGVVGLDELGEQREGAVVELHGHAVERAEGRRDLQELEATGWSGPSRARWRCGTAGCSRSGRLLR